jgi:hypothetical protein
VDVANRIVPQPYYLLQEVLDELEMNQYWTRLVQNGFEMWEKVLSITESDLERLDFKLGHRRKLQQKIRKFNEELLASTEKEGSCYEQHGQSWQRSLSSSSSSTCGTTDRITMSTCSPLSAHATDGAILFWYVLCGRVEANILTTMSPAEKNIQGMLDQSYNTAPGRKDGLQDPLADTLDAMVLHPGSSATTRSHQPFFQMNGHRTKCLYVQPLFGSQKNPQEILYREIYIREYTVDSFLHSLAKKCGIARDQIVEVSRISIHGDRLLFDDSTVENLAGGQDMVAKFEETEVAPGWPSLQSADSLCCLINGEGREYHVVSKHYKVHLNY